MGPMKEGRGVLWSCPLRTSISEDAKDASSLLQSRSMDIVSHGKEGLPFKANDLYCSNEDLLRSTGSLRRLHLVIIRCCIRIVEAHTNDGVSS